MACRRWLARLRQPSLGRGIALALAALGAALKVAGFPAPDAPRASNWQLAAALTACWSMYETARCLGRAWSLRHAGVLVLLYAELMILALALFLWVYP